ncbi:MAG: hypothetical protein DRI44_08225 [Chlamydiae bacterium]|nr:MAG: hypothetical protein DRI44_08225 [Chlamydiota bacterium]
MMVITAIIMEVVDIIPAILRVTAHSVLVLVSDGEIVIQTGEIIADITAEDMDTDTVVVVTDTDITIII